MADYRANKKRQLALFLALGAAAVAAMALVREGDLLLASVLFILANIGVNGSFVFYDALLPHVGGKDMDRLSTTGYALGYLGGGIFLILCDILARTLIHPNELPIGVITGLMGGVMFLVVLNRSAKKADPGRS